MLLTHPYSPLFPLVPILQHSHVAGCLSFPSHQGMSLAIMHSGYRLINGPPSVSDYLSLRLRSGLSPKTEAQAVPALKGGWCAYHVVHEQSGATVGMGRVISDGGWYFHVVDIAVLPEHQRKGLGDAIMTAIMNRIHQEAAPGA
jgi:ribosomal protein S18 acetylase RimI-like enzyme